MIYIFNKTIINILCNFIPHETVFFYDRDPPWMSKEIRKMVQEKKNLFNCYRQSNNGKQLLDRLKDLHPVGIYLFKDNNRNTRTRCEICSKLTIRLHNYVNFEQVNAGWADPIKFSHWKI